MHQTRQEISKRLPIPRKGTKYVARAVSNVMNSVPVVIAVRDMLGLAKTQKEVHEMLKEKSLKLNGRILKTENESIQLFNILEAGKKYKLTLLPTGKFNFVESKADERLCKVIGKKILSKGQVQINLNEGSNVLTKDKINIGDSVYLDFSGKIIRHITLQKGKEAMVFQGKYSGATGKIVSIEGKKVLINLKDKEVALNQSSVMVI